MRFGALGCGMIGSSFTVLACSGGSLDLPFPFPEVMGEGQSEILVVDSGGTLESFFYRYSPSIQVPVTLTDDDRVTLEAYVFDFELALPDGRLPSGAGRSIAADPRASLRGLAGAGEFSGWEPIVAGSASKFAEVRVPAAQDCLAMTSGRSVELSFDSHNRFFVTLDDQRALAGYANGHLILVERPFEVQDLGDFGSDRTQGAIQVDSELFLLGRAGIHKTIVGSNRQVTFEPFGPPSADVLRWGGALDRERFVTLARDGAIELFTETTTRVLHRLDLGSTAINDTCGGLALHREGDRATAAAALGSLGRVVVLTLEGEDVVEVERAELGTQDVDQVCSLTYTPQGFVAGTSAGGLFRFDEQSRQWRSEPFPEANRLLIDSIQPRDDSFLVAAGPFISRYSRTTGTCPIDQRVTAVSVLEMAIFGPEILIAFDPSDPAHEQLALVTVAEGI